MQSQKVTRASLLPWFILYLHNSFFDLLYYNEYSFRVTTFLQCYGDCSLLDKSSRGPKQNRVITRILDILLKYRATGKVIIFILFLWLYCYVFTFYMLYRACVYFLYVIVVNILIFCFKKYTVKFVINVPVLTCFAITFTCLCLLGFT